MTNITNSNKASEASERSGATRTDCRAAATAPKKETKAVARRRPKPMGTKEKPLTKEKELPNLAVPVEPRQTKAATVEAMLCRKEGVSLDAICTATGWQAHTCRAFLTGLRKKGKEILRERDKDGTTTYRIGSDAPTKANA